MQGSVGSKGVRFDVYTKDENRIFDIEIQTTTQKNLPKRARYYQSVIDMDNLSHGEKYSQLKDSYVIFLCLFDPFSENLPVYFFENICRGDDKIKLNDGAYKVFFNAADYAKIENDEEKNFFKFLSGHIVFIYHYNALKSIMPRSRSPAENEKLLLFSFPL